MLHFLLCFSCVHAFLMFVFMQRTTHMPHCTWKMHDIYVCLSISSGSCSGPIAICSPNFDLLHIAFERVVEELAMNQLIFMQCMPTACGITQFNCVPVDARMLANRRDDERSKNALLYRHTTYQQRLIWQVLLQMTDFHSWIYNWCVHVDACRSPIHCNANKWMRNVNTFVHGTFCCGRMSIRKLNLATAQLNLMS